ncbi:tripartite tricarboxylate transporter TctA [Aeromonas sp. A35_P]|uniref:tripartite tricarboxylate transporter permease n=1 Tax=Aeromonas sp. A35_P TaxID=1983805 RepID=UPI000B9B9293|nr:tripartite tricarboxylate transporter permease [Aeromonas sp. A35_P]OZG43727.1 tripartite tricarboxylate transporter TctA [Aeromonas sp. A35_P]
MLDGILQGLGTALLPVNLMMVVLGCFIGTFIGMLPGLGPVTAIALMIPITYGLDPSSGIILMAGVYYGAIFGGSTSSILINAPGCSATVVTAFDGYPLACKGQAGKALAMATFALAEILMAVLRPGKDNSEEEARQMQQLGSLKLSKEEVREIAPPIARSSVLGFLIGVLPGAGATIAAFMAYGAERNIAGKQRQEQFGKGSLRGLAAPEAANNAASTGSFVPLLTLGIPGSGTTALILGALVAYGIQPGPRLFMEHPDVFWSVIISMYLGNVVLLILNLPLIPYLAKVLAVPRPVLIPMVLLFSLTGVYLVSFNTMDIHVMTLVALIAIGLRLLTFPMAPMLLGFILGGMLEDNLRRALVINDGSLSFLWERPITLVFTVITLTMLLLPLWQWWQARRAPAARLQSEPS